MIELQEVNPEHGQALIVGIPDRREDLGTVTRVQHGHTNQPVFVAGEGARVHPLSTLAVLHVRHVLSRGTGARHPAQIGEMLLHEFHLIFPEGHVVQVITNEVGTNG